MSRHPCPSLILSSSLAPYSIPPSVFILTGYGVYFPKRQGYCSYGSVYLMLWTSGSFLLALLLTRCRFVFCAFFPIYKQHLPLIFHYFNPADLLEKETVAHFSPAFTSVSLSVAVFRAIQKATISVIFHLLSSFFFFIFASLVRTSV